MTHSINPVVSSTYSTVYHLPHSVLHVAPSRLSEHKLSNTCVAIHLIIVSKLVIKSKICVFTVVFIQSQPN